MFCIKICYTTGDSFRTWEEEEILDYGWKNIEIVRENLNRLAEHYKIMERGSRSYGDDVLNHNEKMKELKNQRWTIIPTQKDLNRYSNDDWLYESSIMLLTDNNEPFRCSVSSWNGYFEHVQSMEITTKADENKIYF